MNECVCTHMCADIAYLQDASCTRHSSRNPPFEKQSNCAHDCLERNTTADNAAAATALHSTAAHLAFAPLAAPLCSVASPAEEMGASCTQAMPLRVAPMPVLQPCSVVTQDEKFC